MPMNHIMVKRIRTVYQYEEEYIHIDGISLPAYAEKFVKEAGDQAMERFGSLMGLCPAQSKDLLWEGERRFIRVLLARMEPTVVPILVCEEDLDLSCIVFVVSVRKEGAFVYWDKLGYVSHEKEDLQKELKCGILHLSSYSEEDWLKYGDNIAWADTGSEEWKKWISENWEEELFRRRMNYTLPYYEDEQNIIWLKQTDWIFSREEYQRCIACSSGRDK